MPVDTMHRTTRRRDPGSLLASQMEALAGGQVSVTLKRERPWASITFTGMRHSFAVDWAGATNPNEKENLAKTLPDHEFTIPGYFVADILVTEQSKERLLVEALSIIDPVERSRD